MDARDVVQVHAHGLSHAVPLGPQGERQVGAVRLRDHVGVHHAGHGAQTREGAVEQELRPHLTEDLLGHAYVAGMQEDIAKAFDPVGDRSVDLADDERGHGGLRDMTGAEVGGTPFDDADDQT